MAMPCSASIYSSILHGMKYRAIDGCRALLEKFLMSIQNKLIQAINAANKSRNVSNFHLKQTLLLCRQTFFMKMLLHGRQSQASPTRYTLREWNLKIELANKISTFLRKPGCRYSNLYSAIISFLIANTCSCTKYVFGGLFPFSHLLLHHQQAGPA